MCMSLMSISAPDRVTDFNANADERTRVREVPTPVVPQLFPNDEAYGLRMVPFGILLFAVGILLIVSGVWAVGLPAACAGVGLLR